MMAAGESEAGTSAEVGLLLHLLVIDWLGGRAENRNSLDVEEGKSHLSVLRRGSV